jgi:hypothetical protein
MDKIIQEDDPQSLAVHVLQQSHDRLLLGVGLPRCHELQQAVEGQVSALIGQQPVHVAQCVRPAPAPLPRGCPRAGLQDQALQQDGLRLLAVRSLAPLQEEGAAPRQGLLPLLLQGPCPQAPQRLPAQPVQLLLAPAQAPQRVQVQQPPQHVEALLLQLLH